MSAVPDRDEFYIGYEDVMPPGHRRHLTRGLAGAGVAAMLVATVALVAHALLEPSAFEFGRPRTVEGVLRHAPYPSLTVDRERIWLAGPGKHGADPLVATVADGRVTLRGALITRRTHRMLEVVPGSVAPLAGGSAVTPSDAAAGAEVTLTGEIVDAKCFLGVMNPGEQTVHRDCAQLCLRGGLPPMLLVRGGLGEEALVLLVSEAGDAIGRELAPIAGLPVEVRGRLSRHDGQLVLRADRSRYRLRGRADAPGR
jgi:hypothetical protein